MRPFSFLTERQLKASGIIFPKLDLGARPGLRCPRPGTRGRKEDLMQLLHPMLQGESLKRLAQGTAAGAVLTVIIGFGWAGWTLGGTAKDMADKNASKAVVAALAPICVDKFQRAADASSNLTELKKVSSWQQASYVEKGGWATLPGSDAPNSALAQACASLLGAAK
jgi:hypothetical protein